MSYRKRQHENPNRWNAYTRGDVWVVSALIGLFFAGGIFAIGYASEEEHVSCVIEKKDAESQKLRTSCGNFQVSSDLGRSLEEDDGRFEAIKVGEEYDIVVAGWDYVNFGIHPNIVAFTTSE